MQIGPKQNKACYVYTNPAKDTELFSVDKVYVLSPRQLIASSKKRLKMAEQAMYRTVVSSITTNLDLAHQVVQIEKRLLKKIDDMEGRLQEHISTTTSEIAATDASVFNDDGSVQKI
jgi:hypothetical protein